MEARWHNHYCCGIALSITYSECVSVALFIRHAMRMCRIILPPAVCLVPTHFPTLSHKLHDFPKRVPEHKMCVLIFCTNIARNISHPTNNWARCDQSCVSVCMYSAGCCCCCQIFVELEYLTDFWKIQKCQISRKTLYLGAEVLHADGQTYGRQIDMTSLIVAFRNFNLLA